MATRSIFDDQNHLKLTRELDRILNRALRSNQNLIDSLDEVKTLYGWYREARKDPDEIPTAIVNEAIKRLVENLEPRFYDFLVGKINVAIEIDKTGLKIKKVEFSFTLKPYVEYIKRVDNTEPNKVKLTFAILIAGKIEGIMMDRKQGRRDVFVEKVSAPLTVSILRGDISTFYVSVSPISKPIILYHNENLILENLSFHL